jgi:hypothetical protein
MSESATSFPLDGLLDLACRDGVDIRPTLLRVLTDLYVQKPTHSGEEETQYVELALGLIDAVDAATREAVGARLSRYPTAPEAVLRRLSGQAAPQPAAMPAAVAAAVTPPAPTAKPAVPAAEDLAALFFMAGADERRLILNNLDATASPTTQPPAPASNEMIRRLEAAALTRNTSEFTRLLERAMRIGPEVAARIVRDYSGEPIVVVAKALGMKADVLQRILLFLNPVVGQSVERVFSLAQLYDEISLATAARMLAIWHKDGERRRPVHAPQLYDDERRRARAATSPSRQRDEKRDAASARSRSGTR